MIKTILAFSALIALGCIVLNAEEPPRKLSIPKDASSDIRELITALSDNNPKRRATAAFKLGTKGNAAEPAIPFLVKNIDDSTKLDWNGINPEEGRMTKESLNKMTPNELLRSFMRTQTSPGKEAAVALGKIGEKGLSALVAKIEKENSEYLPTAAEGIRNIRDKKMVSLLLKIMNHQDRNIRFSAIEALGQIGDPSAVLPCIESLKDKDDGVRMSAAEAVGKFNDSRCEQPLLDCLADDSASVRKNAAYSLGLLKSKKAIKPLIDLLNDKGTKRYAWLALKKITGKDISEDQAKWREYAESIENNFTTIRAHQNTTKLSFSEKEAHVDITSSPQVTWQDACARNTIYAYQSFVRKHPENPHAVAAKSKIQVLYKKRRPELRDVRKARLELLIEIPGYSERRHKYLDILMENSKLILYCKKLSTL